ncbi:MAG: hypothetical protein L6R41_007260 [Letrouitia leprolyta]|nr:MAG: hypothetical protein L6R41_007260 [Letrouitia leprolyta]
MPFDSQFSLSLEIAKVFPVRQLVQAGAEELVSLVRALRKDGSDFLVKEDLANVFGRGRIEPALEPDFRKAACSNQTSQYPWEKICASVENRFPKSIRWFYTEQSPLKSLSPHLLLGAMDYLYMTRSLPEDRLVMIDNPTGMPPIVVWAHYILGLNVLITNSPDGDVGFGSIESPQVRIKWDSEWSLNSSHSDEQGSTSSNLSNTRASPDIYLLDADMHVLLETEPSENTATEIVGQESHRLRGYGTTFLRRLFNTDSLITDDDPIFADTANFAVTVAILFSRKMRRSSPSFGVAHQQENPKQCYFNTPQWPLFNASHVLFWGIELDKRKIVGQLGKLVGTRVIDMALPTNLRNYISRIGQPNHDGESPVFENYPQDEFLAENMHKLVSWILSFAQEVDEK